MNTATKILSSACALVILNTGVAQGQSCGAPHYGCSPEAHTAPVELFNDINMPHETCNVCPGIIFNCHSSCSTFGLITREAMAGIVLAAQSGDIDAVLLLAPLVGGRVTFNPARQAVQILDCANVGVVATLPVRRQSQLAIAKRLPRSQQEEQVAASAAGWR